MILAAVVALSLAAPDKVPVGPRHGDHTRESRRLGGRSGTPAPPLFRFAPSTGAGMTEECACTNPTGSRGEALTFTRSSAATCTKGNVLTGIDDGDLVSCAADQPRVMRGGDGSGAKGLMVEVARTNVILRSQEMDNASWGNSGTAPVIRADYGTAPDGTQSADAIQFMAIVDGAESGRYQSGLGVVGTGTCSLYLKAAPPADGGVAVAGSIDLTTGAAANPCTTCSYTTDSWSRCILSGTISTYLFLGNESVGACADGARTEQNVYVWGVQCEAGVLAGTYIPTTNAAATRTIEDASFTVATQSSGTGISMTGKSVSWGWPTGATAVSGPVSIGADATNNLRNTLSTSGTVGVCGYLSTGQNGTSSATSTMAANGAENKKTCVWTGSAAKQRYSVYNGVTGATGTSASATDWNWSTIKLQGEYTDATLVTDYRRPNVVVKEICVNNSATKCQKL